MYIRIRLQFLNYYSSAIMEGTPYHKKRKKGAKRKLERRKEYSTPAPENNRENVPPPQLQCTMPDRENVPPPQLQCTMPALPKHWQVHATDDKSMQYIKINPRIGEMCQVSSSVALHQNGTWTAFFMGEKIPPSNAVLATFPQNITPSTLQSLILSIDNAVLCPGNPDEDFVSVCKGKKDGKMSGERGFGQTIAFIDDRESHRKSPAIIMIHVRSM